MLGGVQYLKQSIFMQAQKARSDARGSGFFFEKKMVQFGAIWCILGPILAPITLLFLRLFFGKSENKEKEEP